MQVDLVRRAQGGDHDAFDRLATDAYDRLVAVAARILQDTDRGEDAVQDALVLAWRDLPRLNDPERFDAWVHRILVRACSDAIRRTRRRPVEIVLDIEGTVRGTPDGSSDLADRDQLERAFRRLSVDQRAVVVLHHYLDLRAAEISDMLGVPVGTVNSRLHYATRVLRAALEADLRVGGRPREEAIG